MVSQDKLIKQGIYLTDNVFEDIIRQLKKGINSSDTLEAFINKTKDYTMNNPLVVNGFKDDLLEIILRESNNHKFGRPAQKQLVRTTIENRVGDLIVDVGDDIKNSVRDIVKDGYNNNLSQDEIAENITHRVSVIKNTRARVIARTEIARTATASDYVINKERGATHFTVDCRDTCCEICAHKYNWGNIEYTIDQVEMLPPLHPNCRCYALFFRKGGELKASTKKPVSTTQTTTTTTNELSLDELNKMSFQELADYYGLEYRGESHNIITKQREHFFVEIFEDGRRMSITFESNAVESYLKKGIATPNEIIAEIMKVPKALRNETNGITFRDTNLGLGLIKNGELVDDELDANTLGYNRTRIEYGGYEHRIIMNPRLFKGSKGPGAKNWIPNDEDIIRWKKNMHHEFEHSGDQDQALYDSDDYMPHCWSDEYDEVHQKERYFTEYANSEREESWAEHGGYISYMEANPSEQHRLITINIFEDGLFKEKKINYSEYKKMYPAHYEFFMKRHAQ